MYCMYESTPPRPCLYPLTEGCVWNYGSMYTYKLNTTTLYSSMRHTTATILNISQCVTLFLLHCIGNIVYSIVFRFLYSSHCIHPIVHIILIVSVTLYLSSCSVTLPCHNIRHITVYPLHCLHLIVSMPHIHCHIASVTLHLSHCIYHIGPVALHLLNCSGHILSFTLYPS
jgi:hypothetical protein